jgi:hypothetical protein
MTVLKNLLGRQPHKKDAGYLNQLEHNYMIVLKNQLGRQPHKKDAGYLNQVEHNYMTVLKNQLGRQPHKKDAGYLKQLEHNYIKSRSMTVLRLLRLAFSLAFSHSRITTLVSSSITAAEVFNPYLPLMNSFTLLETTSLSLTVTPPSLSLFPCPPT